MAISFRFTKLTEVANFFVRLWKDTQNIAPSQPVCPRDARTMARIIKNALGIINPDKRRKMSGLIKVTTAYNKVRRYVKTLSLANKARRVENSEADDAEAKVDKPADSSTAE